MEKTTDGDKLAAVLLYYRLIESAESQEMKIICPFHADKNPSMKVDFATGFWYCFGCQEGGKWRKFILKMEGSELKAELVKQKIMKGEVKSTGLVIKQVSPEVARRRQRQLRVEAMDYYVGLPKVAWASYGDREVMAVRDYMIDRGFTVQSLQRARAKFNYSRDYKLIFPITDNGRFKGWVCRTTDPKVAKYRKYLYNKGFSRRNTVVGSYGQHCDGPQDYVVIVEGFMDRLKLEQLGVKNAVAIFGWKITPEQVEKLKEAGIKFVASALDNDDCGRRGTECLRKHFDVIRWPYLKGIKDPGDFTQESFFKMSKKFEQKLLKYERSKNGTARQDQGRH